jgi:dolichol kinase
LKSIKSNPVSRGLFHLIAGLFFPILALSVTKSIILIALGTITAVFVSLDLLRFRYPGLTTWAFRTFHMFLRNTEKSQLTGASYLLVASLISFLVFPRDIAVLSLCFLAVGDPLASMAGSQIGKIKIFGKTLEGTLVCFTACLVSGLILLKFSIHISWLLIILGAFVATLAELVPLRINDNILIPLSAGAVMLAVQSVIA